MFTAHFFGGPLDGQTQALSQAGPTFIVQTATTTQTRSGTISWPAGADTQVLNATLTFPWQETVTYHLTGPVVLGHVAYSLDANDPGPWLTMREQLQRAFEQYEREAALTRHEETEHFKRLVRRRRGRSLAQYERQQLG